MLYTEYAVFYNLISADILVGCNRHDGCMRDLNVNVKQQGMEYYGPESSVAYCHYVEIIYTRHKIRVHART